MDNDTSMQDITIDVYGLQISVDEINGMIERYLLRKRNGKTDSNPRIVFVSHGAKLIKN